jgi:hypothetical protein
LNNKSAAVGYPLRLIYFWFAIAFSMREKVAEGRMRGLVGTDLLNYLFMDDA